MSQDSLSKYNQSIFQCHNRPIFTPGKDHHARTLLNRHNSETAEPVTTTPNSTLQCHKNAYCKDTNRRDVMSQERTTITTINQNVTRKSTMTTRENLSECHKKAN